MGFFNLFREDKPSPSASQMSYSAASPSQGPRTYVIKTGDSLSKIAKQFYGRATDWHKLHEANSDKIRNPSILHPGEEIVIP